MIRNENTGKFVLCNEILSDTFTGKTDSVETAGRMSTSRNALAEISDGAAMSKAILGSAPLETNLRHAGVLARIAGRIGMSVSNFASLVGAKASKLRIRFSKDILRKSAVLIASAVLGMIGPEMGDPAFIVDKMYEVMTNVAGVSPAYAVQKTANETREFAKGMRIFDKAPETTSFSASMNSQGDENDCVSRSAIRAIEELFGKKFPVGTAERFHARRDGAKSRSASYGVDFRDADRILQYIFGGLGIDVATEKIRPDEKTFVERLGKGNVLLVNLSNASSPAFSGLQGKPLSEGMITGKGAIRKDSPLSRTFHTVSIVGYVEDSGKTKKNGEKIPAFIVSNPWNVGDKGYVMVATNDLLGSVVGEATALERMTDGKTYDFGKLVENFDPEGTNIEVRRSIADEVVTSLRLEAKSLADSISKLRTVSQNSPEWETQSKNATKKALDMALRVAVVSNAIENMSGEKVTVSVEPLRKIAGFIAKGQTASALREAIELDGKISKEIAPEFVRAGLSIEMSVALRKSPLELVAEISDMLRVPFGNGEFSQGYRDLRSESYKNVYHRLMDLGERIGKIPGKEQRDEHRLIIEGIGNTLPVIKEMYEKSLKEGFVEDSRKATDAFMSNVSSPARNEILKSLFETLERTAPSQAEDESFLKKVTEMTTPELDALRNIVASNERKGTPDENSNIWKSVAKAEKTTTDKTRAKFSESKDVYDEYYITLGRAEKTAEPANSGPER